VPLEYVAEKTTVVAKNDDEFNLQDGEIGVCIKLDINSQSQDK